MTTWNSQTPVLRLEMYEAWDGRRIEKMSRLREREWGVRSDMSRTRARMRNRGSAAARSKAQPFNGVNRRGRHRHLALSF